MDALAALESRKTTVRLWSPANSRLPGPMVLSAGRRRR